MAGATNIRLISGRARPNQLTEPRWVRWSLIGVTLAFLGLFLVVPLASVFAEAFRKGWGVYLDSIREPVALAAIKLTLLTAGIAVPCNLVFGWPRPGRLPNSNFGEKTF